MTGLYCRGRGFRGLSTDIDAPSSPLHPTFDFVDIYAYPGWEPDSVIHTAADLLWDRPGGLGDIEATSLLSGVYVNIKYQSCTIRVEDQAIG